MFSNFKDILNISELCEALSIGRNSAYNLIRNGALKAIRIGTVYKIPKQYLIDYVVNNAQISA